MENNKCNCAKHMAKIEAIRKQMAQKYIDKYKEKLIKYIKENEVYNEFYFEDEDEYKNMLIETYPLLEKIKNGDFD